MSACEFEGVAVIENGSGNLGKHRSPPLPRHDRPIFAHSPPSKLASTERRREVTGFGGATLSPWLCPEVTRIGEYWEGGRFAPSRGRDNREADPLLHDPTTTRPRPFFAPAEYRYFPPHLNPSKSALLVADFQILCSVYIERSETKLVLRFADGAGPERRAQSLGTKATRPGQSLRVEVRKKTSK